MRTTIAVAAVALLGACGQAASQQPAPGAGAQAQAVFATGCFWCTESDFDKVPGVISTTSGYTGGKLANPTYEQVSAGGTGHIEAVQVVYDPKRVTYGALAVHAMRTSDPLDAGGQFCDRGYQYRAALFAANPAERTRCGGGESARVGRPQEAHRHPDPAGRALLSGRNLPSGLLQEEPDPLQILPPAVRTRRTREGGLGLWRVMSDRLCRVAVTGRSA
jgi:methionine-S-sulfoxide reductase